MTTLTTSPRATGHRGRWKWFLALGVVLLVLGTAAVGGATVLELTNLLVFGPLLLTSSAMQLMTAFVGEKGSERLLHYVAAALEAFLGFFVMARPVEDLGGLIALIAILFLMIGLARLGRALAARSRGRAWAVMTGVVALLLGVSVWIGWPGNGPWFVGLCIAADFLCHGVSWSALALAQRRDS
jgi:uncharacterized membrane protein HdeD (DUF308 family)